MVDYWTAGMVDYWIELLEWWTTGLDYWNGGLLDWTTGMVDYWTGNFSMQKSHWSNFTFMVAYCLASCAVRSYS